MAAQMNRRILGMLGKRLDEAALDEVEDRRDDRGKRWPLGSLLRAVVGAMLSGSGTSKPPTKSSILPSRRPTLQPKPK